MAENKRNQDKKNVQKTVRNQNRQPGKEGIRKPATKNARDKASFFERSEIKLVPYLNRIFYVILFVTAVFGLLLFDVRFSLAGDDSAYVERAYEFIHHFRFPGFQGPMYPLILSPFVAVFGISAIPLKGLSLVFILGFFCFFYYSFRTRIPALLLISVLALVSVNSFILYYTSQTFSEAFFMMLQGLTLFVFFSFFLDNEIPKPMKIQVRNHLLLALCLLFTGLTRSIGYAALIVVLVSFTLRGQWKNLLMGILAFTFVLFVYEGLRILIWGGTGPDFSGAAHDLMSRDYYNPALGNDDLAGFLNRFMANTDFYLSQSFYTIIGIRRAGNTIATYPFLTITTIVVFLASLVVAARKNKYVFFSGIYVFLFLGITFLIAHEGWKQSRFIIPYFPLILVLVLALAYETLNDNRRAGLQVLFPALALVLFGLSVSVTASQASKMKQINGEYSGLSPDMENYCRLSAWTNGNLPENAVIACRKPSISFVYSKGRNFFGITHLLFYPAGTLVSKWEKGNLPYVVIPITSINNRRMPRTLFNALSAGIVGWGMNTRDHLNTVQFLVMNFPDSIREKTLKEMKANNVSSSNDRDSISASLKDPGAAISIVYVDSLVSFLLKSRITHVLTESLRINPATKNNQVVGTLEKYLKFVELKYPEIFRKIVQMGDNDNEPAILYELDYARYGLKIPG